MDRLYHYNEEMCQWERVDNTQFYKGVKIETVTSHVGIHGYRNHREYRITYKDGTVQWFPINKRGCNIKNLKECLDFKVKE